MLMLSWNLNYLTFAQMGREIFKFCHVSPLNKTGSFIQAFIAKNMITGIFLTQNFTTKPKVLTALH